MKKIQIQSRTTIPIMSAKIISSQITKKSAFKDRNRIDTVEPNTLVGFEEDADCFDYKKKKNEEQL